MKKFSRIAAVMAAAAVLSAGMPAYTAEYGCGLGIRVSATDKLDAPSDIKASASSDSVTLTWDKVKGADAYSVYKYDSSDKKFKSYKSVTGTSCKVTGLTKGVTYSFKVAALVKSGGKYVLQELSDTVSVKTGASASDNVKKNIQDKYSGTTVTYSSKDDKFTVVKLTNTDKSAKLSASAKKTWSKTVSSASDDADKIEDIIEAAGMDSSCEYVIGDKNKKVLLRIEDGDITYNYSEEKTSQKTSSKKQTSSDDKGHEDMKDEIRKMYKKKNMDVTVSYMEPSDTYTVKYKSTLLRSEVEAQLKKSQSYADKWEDMIDDAEVFVDDVRDMLEEKGYSSTVIFEYHDKNSYPLFKVKNGEESYNYADSVTK
ncbi:MAG: fibronectin type III domain-containing protein [Ruminococcus sp.]|nr:fibronectin type III domain-containing protein [Ruminococcus sp.]